jgi:hypothetical protein
VKKIKQRCFGCGKDRELTALDAMIGAAVETENLKRQGRVEFNIVTGGVTPIIVKADLSRFREPED